MFDVLMPTSQNALDLDQDTIVSQLSLGTVEGIDAAMKVYKEGAYCDPIATLFLEEPLPRPLVEGDEVRTLSSDDLEVKGGVLTNYPKGREVISVRYDIGKVQIDYVGCLVGGNPMPSFEECTLSIFFSFESEVTLLYGFVHKKRRQNLIHVFCLLLLLALVHFSKTKRFSRTGSFGR